MAATQPHVKLAFSPQNLPSPQALWTRLNPYWLTGYGDRNAQINQEWFANVRSRCHQLQQHETAARPLLLIAEPDPLHFLASFWAALLSGWNVALVNPAWGDREWNSALQILRPTLVWPSERAGFAASMAVPAVRPYASILIPTGGTSGQIKFAHHTWDTLLTAAASFCQTFPTPIHTYCVLPAYHVSGLMQMLRAWLSQAQVVITPFKALETQSPLVESPTRWYISLVPTQLARLIAARKGSWLSQFQAVLLGGAPPWPDLLARATQHKIPFRLSYGMTETAAMVAIQGDNEAAQNTENCSSGTALPHAKITIEIAGKPQPPRRLGQVVIHSAAIAHGYYGKENAAFSPQTFRTDDLGYLTTQGQLFITGRASSKIISGGENIFPAEVEAALYSTGQVKDIHIFSQLDPQWGEAVVAAFVPANSKVNASSLKAALSNGKKGPLLSHYKHPKNWISLSFLPRNDQGKLLKSELMKQIEQLSSAPNSQAADSDGDYLSE